MRIWLDRNYGLKTKVLLVTQKDLHSTVATAEYMLLDYYLAITK